MNLTNNLHGFVVLNYGCAWLAMLPHRRVYSMSIFFFFRFVFLPVLQFLGTLNFRALFLPLTWWPPEGFLLTRNKWNFLFNIYFSSRYLRVLSEHLERPEELPVLKYILLPLFHISISRFLLNFPTSHLLFASAVSASENTTFSHLDVKRRTLNVDCMYLRHRIGGTSLVACDTAGRKV